MLSALHTWTLTAIAVVSGVAMLLAFRRFSDQQRIGVAKRKIWAHLYEFRLFADDPALLLRPQRQLLAWNARYLGLMLRPAAVVLIPMAALLIHLDAAYGRRPLRPGEQAIVTAEIARLVDLGAVLPDLTGDGAVIETPAVRVPDQHQVYWRIHPVQSNGGTVLLRVAGPAVAKRVQAGGGLRYVSERRVAGVFDWLRYPAEPRLPEGSVRNIEVSYPAAELDIFGHGVHWLLWFFAVSSATMLALRKRFRVTF